MEHQSGGALAQLAAASGEEQPGGERRLPPRRAPRDLQGLSAWQELAPALGPLSVLGGALDSPRCCHLSGTHGVGRCDLGCPARPRRESWLHLLDRKAVGIPLCTQCVMQMEPLGLSDFCALALWQPHQWGALPAPTPQCSQL